MLTAFRVQKAWKSTSDILNKFWAGAERQKYIFCITLIFSPALAKAKLGCSRHCHKSVCMTVCMYVCVSGCPRSPFSPKLLDQILPKLTGGCFRTSRCALLQMILIWLALWPQKSNRQENVWVNPHVGTGMDGWAASWNSRPGHWSAQCTELDSSVASHRWPRWRYRRASVQVF